MNTCNCTLPHTNPDACNSCSNNTNISFIADTELFSPRESFRWLKKKNGEKILQQLWIGSKGTWDWRDIEEVEEENNKE